MAVPCRPPHCPYRRTGTHREQQRRGHAEATYRQWSIHCRRLACHRWPSSPTRHVERAGPCHPLPPAAPGDHVTNERRAQCSQIRSGAGAPELTRACGWLVRAEPASVQRRGAEAVRNKELATQPTVVHTTVCCSACGRCPCAIDDHGGVKQRSDAQHRPPRHRSGCAPGAAAAASRAWRRAARECAFSSAAFVRRVSGRPGGPGR